MSNGVIEMVCKSRETPARILSLLCIIDKHMESKDNWRTSSNYKKLFLDSLNRTSIWEHKNLHLGALHSKSAKEYWTDDNYSIFQSHQKCSNLFSFDQWFFHATQAPVGFQVLFVVICLCIWGLTCIPIWW